MKNFISQDSELANCGSIKAILMLFVVLYHSLCVFVSNGWGPYEPATESPVLGVMAEWLGTFHIYGFALISGYIFYYIKFNGGGYQRYLPFLGNKAKRLLIPYIFIAAIWVIPVYIYFWGVEDVITKFVLGTSPSQLWFLLMLFWAFFLFWPISRIVDKKPVFGGVLVSILFCLGVVVPNYFCIGSGLQYTLFFYFGFLIRKFDLGNKILYKVPSFIYILINVILFIVVKLVERFDGLLFTLLILGFNVILHSISAIGVFILLQRFVNRFLQNSKVINFFAKHSMIFYLVHQQLIYFSIGWFNTLVPPVVLVLINFAFAMIISTIFSVLMSMTKVTRFLVGSK